ncbi:hypothetical protein P168DRAFT_131653 [Aspergillus campestris IBT 28561]|uniref:Uncharacterized protein n=1 Tax=Aspergillus campestris (strain IBT 28561) TaxID=1392248 RepID=A0A2I1D7M7_ASPC2|nr:uncharacterized protein P168DRAFT_131653 [Aspergillus campestris IBT 28561]PKY05863.1 hypothetical protein P168DRAFT_131653 [Aspergillus campestris IBT 28561]
MTRGVTRRSTHGKSAPDIQRGRLPPCLSEHHCGLLAECGVGAIRRPHPYFRPVLLVPHVLLLKRGYSSLAMSRGVGPIVCAVNSAVCYCEQLAVCSGVLGGYYRMCRASCIEESCSFVLRYV